MAQLYKPVYAEMFAKVRKAGLHVWFHSDGNILDIIPDLIEIGVNVINCQASLMGLDTLSRFAGKVASLQILTGRIYCLLYHPMK